MKMRKNLRLFSMIAMTTAAATTFTGCNGGGAAAATVAAVGAVATVAAINSDSAYEAGYSDGSSDGYNSGYSDGYSDGSSDSSDSIGAISKDTDLQKATLQKMSVTSRAQLLVNSFQMSMGAAVQLTQLSDRVKSMAVQGAMSDSDKAAVSEAAFSVAGISTADVTGALSKYNAGDETAANNLMQKAAINLGMPSSSALRDKLLPALGINTTN
jgi:hypothetical protein